MEKYYYRIGRSFTLEILANNNVSPGDLLFVQDFQQHEHTNAT